MSFGQDLHHCHAQKYYKSNPHAPTWHIDTAWFGWALQHSFDSIRIVFCPWCGAKLDKDALKIKEGENEIL